MTNRVLVDLGPGRARFDYLVSGAAVAVFDLGPHEARRTVTNDAEAVVDHLRAVGALVLPMALVYRDSGGTWGRITWTQNRGFTGFAPMKKKTLTEALRAAWRTR